MAKLTPAQQRGIEYFQYLLLPAAERKALRQTRKSPSYPDPRVIKALCDMGRLELSHHSYGPHYKLTAAK